MTTQTRIYLAKSAHGDRLVRAANQAQALRHVAQSAFKIHVATQDELVSLVAAGSSVETASQVEGEGTAA